jgi:hypothetical protein
MDGPTDDVQAYIMHCDTFYFITEHPLRDATPTTIVSLSGYKEVKDG